MSEGNGGRTGGHGNGRIWEEAGGRTSGRGNGRVGRWANGWAWERASWRADERTVGGAAKRYVTYGRASIRTDQQAAGGRMCERAGGGGRPTTEAVIADIAVRDMRSYRDRQRADVRDVKR